MSREGQGVIHHKLRTPALSSPAEGFEIAIPTSVDPSPARDCRPAFAGAVAGDLPDRSFPQPEK